MNYEALLTISIVSDSNRKYGFLEKLTTLPQIKDGGDLYYLDANDEEKAIDDLLSSNGYPLKDIKKLPSRKKSVKENNSKLKDFEFLYLAIIHDEKKSDFDKAVLGNCLLRYEKKKRKGKKSYRLCIVPKKCKEISSPDTPLVLEDLENLLRTDFKSACKNAARQNRNYISIERSKIAIDRVAFYLFQGGQKKHCVEKDEKDSEELKQECLLPDYSKDYISKSQSDSCRLYPENNNIEEMVYRKPYQLDYERIVNSKSFRRLVDKAQLFSSVKGDHYRTRMTHTLAVAQIAKAIAFALDLDLDLTEAIALGHDVGHTPFGHQGERTLDDILTGRTLAHLGIVDASDNGVKSCSPYGGFKHNAQSVRVLAVLEESHFGFRGINASAQVLEGILWHTKVPKIEEVGAAEFNYEKTYLDWRAFVDNDASSPREKSFWDYVFHNGDYDIRKKGNEPIQHSLTLEGQVVGIADEIAQRSHDLDDAIASGSITLADLKDISRINSLSTLKDILDELEKTMREDLESRNNIVDPDRLFQERVASIIVTFLIGSVVSFFKSSYDEGNCFEEMPLPIDDCDLHNELSPSDKRPSSHEAISDKKTENGGESLRKDSRLRIVDFDDDGKKICGYLESVVNNKVVTSSEVAIFDRNGGIVVRDLFEAYYGNPSILPSWILKGVALEERTNGLNSAIDLSECCSEVQKKEIINIKDSSVASIHDQLNLKTLSIDQEYGIKKRLLVRAIVDYIAGMTDSYAISEHKKLYGTKF